MALVLLTLPLLRRRLYELFLRTHQALAVATAVCAGIHLGSIKDYNRLPLYVFAGGFCLVASMRIVLMAYQNKRLGYPCPRVLLKLSHGTIKATIILSRPLQVDAGQYINLWVPSVSLLSSHPFMVTSWAPTPQGKVKLYIQPRQGFTRTLASRASAEGAQHISSRAFFSLHGSCMPVWDYECVLLFATGYGVAAMLPFLSKLLYGYKERKSFTKRIHLVWQVQGFGK